MMQQRLSRAACVLSILALAQACDGGGAVSTSRQSVDAISCGAGTTPWVYSKVANDRFRLTYDNSVARDVIATISAGDGCWNKNAYNWCKGTGSACSAVNEGGSRILHNGPACTVSYTCAGTPTVNNTWKASDAAYFRCSGRDLTRPDALTQTCVPENCYGRTRRNEFMQCVPDPAKSVVPHRSELKLEVNSFDRETRSLLASPYTHGVQGSPRTFTIGDDVVYDFEGTFKFAGTTVPSGQLAIWLKTTFSKDQATTPTVEGFRCQLHTIDLGKYSIDRVKNGVASIKLKEKIRVPHTCAEGEPFQAARALALLAKSNPAPNDNLASSPIYETTRLAASFDLEGSSLLLEDQRPEETTCTAKPLDLFRNYKTNTYDLLDYYEQRSIPVLHELNPGYRVISADLSSSTDAIVKIDPTVPNFLAVNKLDVSVLQVDLETNGVPRGEIEANVGVTLTGPQARAIFDQHFGPVAFFDRYEVQQEAIGLVSFNRPSTGLIPVTIDPTTHAVTLHDDARVALPTEALYAQFGPELLGNNASTTMKIKIDRTLRKGVLGNTKYPIAPGKTQNYVLRVCPAAERAGAQRQFWPPGAGEEPAFVPTGQVEALNDITFPLLNTCQVSSVFAFKALEIFTPLPEVDVAANVDATEATPTNNGDDTSSATFDSDTSRSCTGKRCTMTSSNGLRSAGDLVEKEYFSVNSTQDENEDPAVHNSTFSTSLEILGYSVIEDGESKGIGGPIKVAIDITPPWESLAERLKAVAPPPIDIDKKHFSAGISGLSMGLEFKIPVRFGPVQGDAIIGAGAGAGLTFQIEYEYNPDVSDTTSCSTADAGCPGRIVTQGAMAFRDAREACAKRGGELIEPRTDAEEQIFVTQLAATDGGTEGWIGAQVGNQYASEGDCAKTWNSTICSSGHKTSLRWLTDGDPFRKANSFGEFQAEGATPTSFNGHAVTANTIPIAKPVDSAVTLGNNTLRVRPLTNSYPSVCYLPSNVKAKSHTLSLGAELGFSAGVEAGFCVPSADLGVCMTIGVNFIEATITPKIGFTHTQATDAATSKSAEQMLFFTDVTWTVSILSGSVEIALETPIFSISYTLASWGGFQVGAGTLAHAEHALKKDFQ